MLQCPNDWVHLFDHYDKQSGGGEVLTQYHKELRDLVDNKLRSIEGITAPYVAAWDVMKAAVPAAIANQLESIRETESEVAKQLKQVQDHATAFTKEAAAANDDIKSIVADARTAAGITSAASFQQFFDEEARRIENESSRWLKRSSWLFFGALIYAILFTAMSFF